MILPCTSSVLLWTLCAFHGGRFIRSQSCPTTLAEPLQTVTTPLSLAIESSIARDGIDAGSGGADLRPFKIALIDCIRDETPEVKNYILEAVMPATIQLIGRSIRVRRPSGMLDLTSITLKDGKPVPPPPGGAPGYDADLVLQVLTCTTENSSFEGEAKALALEAGTGRPVVGFVKICSDGINPGSRPLKYDLETAFHEMIHVLGFASDLFGSYAGYPEGFPAIVVNSRIMVASPQVLATARAFFNCSSLLGAEFEDDDSGISREGGSKCFHWETRIFEGELMDAQRGARAIQSHSNRHVLTDLTLSLLQDSNWYDVKYGSAGFSSYGYQGGCVFTSGTIEEVLEVDAAKRFVCEDPRDLKFLCHHDHSSAGKCRSLGFGRLLGDEDVFNTVRSSTEIEDLIDPEPDAYFDCQPTPGFRCVREDIFITRCMLVECSSDGEVLISKEACNPDDGRQQCPNAHEMCVDPGYLTCQSNGLNDCNGRGDCYLGQCYCHTGAGGDDCSQDVCVNSCDDGSPCPPSGFCGVPECGTFSSGSADRGIPCNTGPATQGPFPPPRPGTDAPSGVPPDDTLEGIGPSSMAGGGVGPDVNGADPPEDATMTDGILVPSSQPAELVLPASSPTMPAMSGPGEDHTPAAADGTGPAAPPADDLPASLAPVEDLEMPEPAAASTGLPSAAEPDIFMITLAASPDDPTPSPPGAPASPGPQMREVSPEPSPTEEAARESAPAGAQAVPAEEAAGMLRGFGTMEPPPPLPARARASPPLEAPPNESISAAVTRMSRRRQRFTAPA